MTETGSPEARVRAVGLVLRKQLQTLGAELGALDAAGWGAPSWCDGWAVQDVAAHMAESNDRFFQIVSAALQNGPVPEFTPASRAERQAAVKARGGKAIVTQLQERGYATFDLLEGASGEALGRTVTVPAGTLSLAQIAPQRLSECTLHSWDIRYGRDAAATLDAAAVPLLLDGIIAAAPRLASKGAAMAQQAVYRIELTGSGAGDVTLAIGDGALKANRGAPAESVVTLRMPAEAFIRLVWGRLDLATAVGAGAVEVVGARERALELGRVFRPG